MTLAPPAHPVPRPRRTAPDLVDVATQQRRRLHWSATRAGVRARTTLIPLGSVRRRQSLQVCGAAQLLTSLGVRVVVVQPSVPWPRDRPHRMVVANDAGLLGDLALLTAVPRTTYGWAAVADRVLPVRTALRGSQPDDLDAALCPVTVAYRMPDGDRALPPRTLDEVVAVRGLVVEVRLLAVGPEVPRAV
ncbi:MAG: hypothetical protein AVDCRST_MAG57-992 [uncultured Blastococcus sp.]|uniref:Uncharacterized protein n=1 Tax=uncultured Blastococcus sp. TaxID=217144 RepID=A0A6J4HQG2_9ACTN|nr:MAG: hypothetical protein AVDCRST_MAG57-992 [uncultured Blastococcus sp.]